MKIALLGKGKTGSFVSKLHSGEITIFDSKSEISCESLNSHDVIVSFLPGEAFLNLIPILVECNIPVVTGSTGFDWPSDINATLEEKQIPWIYGHNFSLGMNIVKEMIERLERAKSLFENFQLYIHEVHHTKKVDAPSGTALSWDKWIGGDSNITSERIGDVVGDHRITFDTADEKIELSHHAKDRSIFARGALWAANFLHTNKTNPGLHQFNEVIAKEIK
jgi:4-hydroxy-tetrahydrodipicolinate reductase